MAVVQRWQLAQVSIKQETEVRKDFQKYISEDQNLFLVERKRKNDCCQERIELCGKEERKSEKIFMLK